MVTQMHAPTTKKVKQTLAAVGLMSLVALSGCVEGDAENQAPQAVLDTSRQSAWTGESITFDAQSSEDPDGEVTQWRFQFGDGTTMTVDNEDDARVQHAYERGGEFLAKVVVRDDGGEEGDMLTDAAEERVAVNERHAIAPAAVYAVPVDDQNGSTEWTADMYDGVDRYELDLDVTSLLLAGESAITIRILDPVGNVVLSQELAIPAGETIEFAADGPLTEVGQYILDIEAQSGASSVEGELRAFYDAGF